MNLDCLKDIIGLSTLECLKEVEGFDGLNQSVSGKYITDSKYFIPLHSDPCCDPKKQVELLNLAMTQGISDMITDLLMEVGKTSAKNLSVYCETFGAIKANAPLLNFSEQEVGIEFSSKKKKGTLIKLSKIALQINGPVQDYEIKVLCDEDGYTTPIKTVTVSAGNGNLIYAALDCNLKGDKCYRIVYDRNDNRPYDIAFSCLTCGGNVNAPYADHVDFHGVRDGVASSGCKKLTHGLIVDFCICCNPLDFLCQQDEWWWCNTDFGRYFCMVLSNYMARCYNALLYKEKGRIGRLVDKETLLNAQKGLGRTLPKHIKELCSIFPFELTDCLSCIETKIMNVKSNLL